MTQAPTSDQNKEVPLGNQLNKIGEEYDIYREDDETDAEYCDRIVATLDEMINELLDVQGELRILYLRCE